MVVRQGESLSLTKLQCLPLYAILQALQRHHVDFLSINNVGLELNVLRTIPFDKVTFDVLGVHFDDLDAKKKLQEYLEGQGYKLAEVVTDIGNDSRKGDCVFSRNPNARNFKVEI